MIAGTDDDFPPTHQNRIPRGAHLAGNGSAVGSIPYARMYGEIDMETQIHQLEKEAYSSVLRAFKAQADVITWVYIPSFGFHVSNIFKIVWSGFNDVYFFRRRKV